MSTETYLIGTDTAPTTRWWIREGLRLIEGNGDVFSDMREARVKLIAGSNRIRKTIKNWLLAADLIRQDGRLVFLTDNGKRIRANDPDLIKSSTWLAIHLAICFSARGEPYISLFQKLEPSSLDWIDWKMAIARVHQHKPLEKYELSTVKADLEGIRGMFENNGPLLDLELLELRKEGAATLIRLGSPVISDQVIIHALALARHKHFATRITIESSELDDICLNHFLCLSVSSLHNRLREISRSSAWQQHFAFLEGQGLGSIQFGDLLNPKQTLLHLLQDAEDTWI